MDKEFKGVKAFLMIPVGVARDKDLLNKPKSIILMGEIVSMLNTTGEFFMSNKLLAQRLDCTKKTINDYLKLLENKKYIKRQKIFDNSGALVKRKITAGSALVTSTLLGWGNEGNHPSEIHVTTLVKPTSHKYNSLKEHDNRSSNKSLSREKKLSKLLAKKVIEYYDHYSEYWHKPKVEFSDSEIAKIEKAVAGKDLRDMQRAIEKAVVYGEQYPQGYLISCLKNVGKREKVNGEQ